MVLTHQCGDTEMYWGVLEDKTIISHKIVSGRLLASSKQLMGFPAGHG